MTEKRPTPDAAAGKSRRKRAAPTIDLTATDVTPATSEADSPPPPEPAAASAPPVQEARAQEQPRAEDIASSPPGAAKAKPSVAQGFGITLPVLAAGIAGAAVMAILLLTMWLTGLLPVRFAALTITRARVTGLEMQLQDLQKRPATAADAPADSKVIDTLTQRVARMEESLAKLPASDPAKDNALAERTTAADNAMKSLGVALTALNRRSDDIAANAAQARDRADAAEKAAADQRVTLQDVTKAASAGAAADLAPLKQRIAALEQSATTASAEIARIATLATASDAAARLALSTAALRDAVLRGGPYADELAQAKSLGANDKALAPLTPFAATGVPAEKALADELRALLPGMIKAAGAPPASAGFIERLQANASQLVRIRPIDAPPGDDAAAVLARLDIDAARADIAAALADIGKLSEAQRAPAQNWIARANSRQAALAAARQTAADAAHALGSR